MCLGFGDGLDRTFVFTSSGCTGRFIPDCMVRSESAFRGSLIIDEDLSKAL